MKDCKKTQLSRTNSPLKIGEFICIPAQPAETLAGTFLLPHRSDEEQKIFRIKIPKGVARTLISDRQQVNKYETNKTTKAAALFLLLKSLTPSGKIQNWRDDEQRKAIAQLLGINPKTLNTWLVVAEGMNWCEYDFSTDTIKLFSYEQFCESMELEYQGMHVVRLARSAVKQLPLVLYGVEINENKTSQRIKAQKRILLNPRLANALMNELKCSDAQLMEKLKRAQLSSFVIGSTGDELHAVNADDNRALHTIRKAWGMKDRRSAAYIKRKLNATGVCLVTHRRFKSDKATWSKKFFTSYHAPTQMRTTYMPDEITLNTAIYL